MALFAIAVLLLLLAVVVLQVGKAYFYVPTKELKRRAARGDRLAQTLYQAAAYDGDLKLLIWALVAISSAAGFMLFARIAPPLLGFVVIVLGLVLAYLWLPRTRVGSPTMRLAVWLTPPVARVLRLLHPLLKRGSRVVEGLAGATHTGLFEREDVYELIEWQRQQHDSRLSEQDLARMRSALQLGEYKVGDAMVSRKHVKAVRIDEAISPGLLDELYTSGHAYFPVYEDKTTDIVGLLSLDSVAGTKRQGSVRDYYSPHLAYVHEADTLEQALRTFGDSRQHLLAVVNSLNEYVGIITLSDITHWLLGEAEQEQSSHEDREAVAARHGRTRPQDAVAVPDSSPEVVQ